MGSNKYGKYGKLRPDYPYALTSDDKGIPNSMKCSPEEVAMAESMHAEIVPDHIYIGYKRKTTTSSYARSRGESIPENERTELQQKIFLRNLFYRIKQQEKRAKKKIEELEKEIKNTCRACYPLYCDKLTRKLERTKNRLRDILLVKAKYDIT